MEDKLHALPFTVGMSGHLFVSSFQEPASDLTGRAVRFTCGSEGVCPD